MDKKVQIAAVVSADEPSAPGPGEVRVRHEAIGVSFIDIYHRTGLYPLPLPATLGVEGAGVVEAVGPDVSRLSPGDRVAYAGAPVGAYASTRLLPEWRAIALPENISAEMTASSMLRGITAHMLLTRTYPVDARTTILVHAAAGGMGGLLVRWAKQLGAHVIGTAGSPDKAALARAAGADHVIVGRAADIVAEIAAYTGGRGVDVVYDGVGKATFEASLDCLRPRGLMVSYGNASGPVTGVSLSMLQTRGSLYVTRPTTAHYYGDPESLRRTMARVFGAVTAGDIRPSINQRFPLAQAADAHRALEARTTTGTTLLVP